MGSTKNGCSPNKVKENNNSLIDYLKGNEVNWSPTIVSSTGDKFVKLLSGLLWHITCHHGCFLERAAALPSFVTNFLANQNNYTKKQKPKPQLLQTKLKTYIKEISTFLVQPWMSRRKQFQRDINMLVEACRKVCE